MIFQAFGHSFINLNKQHEMHRYFDHLDTTYRVNADTQEQGLHNYNILYFQEGSSFTNNTIGLNVSLLL